MPIKSKEMTGPDLSALLEGLIKADVNFILVGGLAAVVQGAPVTTMDVDIVHNRSSENIVKLLTFLKLIGAFHRRLDDKVIEPTERARAVAAKLRTPFKAIVNEALRAGWFCPHLFG